MSTAILFTPIALGFIVMMFGPEIGKVFSYLTRSKKWKALSITKQDYGLLSSASLAIIAQYNLLPAQNRTYGEIAPVLRAIDKKNGIEKVNQHFNSTRIDKVFGGFGSYPSTSCRSHDRCHGSEHCSYEHTSIYEDITALRKAIEAQEHAMMLAGISSELAEFEVLRERLREERGLVDEITKELT